MRSGDPPRSDPRSARVSVDMLLLHSRAPSAGLSVGRQASLPSIRSQIARVRKQPKARAHAAMQGPRNANDPSQLNQPEVPPQRRLRRRRSG